MPRNGSGTSSVVNSFTPFTVADANDVNENFADIADQLTNSLPRDGQAGMTGQLKADDGTVSLPGITFTNDLDTGVRRIGANKLAVVTAGADKLTFDANGPIATLLIGKLWGLTLSNNAGDATNDIDIAVGYAASDSAVPELMTLGTAITKRLDANWAVGTNQGGLDTGSIANTWYHVWLIQRSDTGVVDALFSTSATSPTMPANYDRKRRIGSVFRQAAALVLFDQLGDTFRWRANRSLTTVTTGYASQLAIPDVPTGVQTQPILGVVISTSGAQSGIISLGSAAAGAVTNEVCAGQSIAGAVNTVRSFITGGFITDTSARIYIQQVVVGGPLSASVIVCAGYIDPRGRI